MIDHVQEIAYVIGKTGCYYLSVLDLGEDLGAAPRDPIATFVWARNRGYVRDDCFMLDPAALLSDLTGELFKVVKAGEGHLLPLDYVCKPGEYEILRFARPPEGGETPDECTHFVRGDGKGNVLPGGDPWGESRTVRIGTLVSKRIFIRL